MTINEQAVADVINAYVKGEPVETYPEAIGRWCDVPARTRLESLLICLAQGRKFRVKAKPKREIWLLDDNQTGCLVCGLGPYPSREASLQGQPFNVTPVRFVEQ